jgi:hypothetical protein
MILHQGAEDDRPRIFSLGHRVDLANGSVCLVNGIYKWQSDPVKIFAVKLSK